MSAYPKESSSSSKLGYQSSSIYLALPDQLKTSFVYQGREHNVAQAAGSDFHAFISQFVEEFDQVDTSTWPDHLRWRVLNACLAEGLLRLAEVPGGFTLCEPQDSEAEEKTSAAEEKTSALV